MFLESDTEDEEMVNHTVSLITLVMIQCVFRLYIKHSESKSTDIGISVMS
jgi:hypothetical protein